jgi:hypothetical protein
MLSHGAVGICTISIAMRSEKPNRYPGAPTLLQLSEAPSQIAESSKKQYNSQRVKKVNQSAQIFAFFKIYGNK